MKQYLHFYKYKLISIYNEEQHFEAIYLDHRKKTFKT